MNNIFPKDTILTLPNNDHDALFSAVNEMAIVSISDLKGNIIYINDKFLEVSKYSRQELIGKNHRILKSGHQSDEMFVDLWKTISSGKAWRGDIKNKAKDGSYYWVDTSIAPILNAAGKPKGYIAVRFLITEKKKTEEDLIQQNIELEKAKKAFTHTLEDIEKEKYKAELLANELVKFKFALDGISDQVVMTDPNGIVIYANEGLKRVTGFSPKEVLGKKAGTKELWGGNMEQKFYEKLWNTLKVEKETFAGEITNKRKNGISYQALSSISPLFDKNGILEYIVAIERDISKEKDVDRAKTEFVSLASHQLRTPLSAINWWTEMLLAGDAGPISDEQKKYLEQIYQSNQRMVELVKALLNVSRIELGTFIVEPTPTDIVDICKIVIKEMEQMIEQKKISFQEEYEDHLPKVNVDPKLTRIIFQNLISNSLKYTPETGKVKVKIKFLKKNEKWNEIEILADTIYITVSDSGYGIPEEQQKDIFTKLFRADNAKEKDTEGTGLGLYIIKSIVENSGGKIWFESKENKGTTFFVLLPLSGMQKRQGERSLD